ncbi:MAG TPA: hypothetical protein VJT85_10385 [Gemmatimonadaceae bacterium]|nr:hypothetical protein [Gemmatimonadaceae bacterium]
MRQRVSSSVTCVAIILSAFLSLALACDAPTAPDVPQTAVPLTPPARFALWWRLTQACSGITGDLAAVSWYVVPNTRSLSYQGKKVDAYWIGNPDRIVLADSLRNAGPIVRHEMLHVLLHRNGHPRDAYLAACGGVVACDGECALEAGVYGSAPASAPVLQPRDVDTRVDVLAPFPAEVGDSGAAAVLITVTNPRTEPVWVRLTPRESGDFQYPTFGVVADYDDPARVAALVAEWSQSSLFPLDAGERRHWVWEGAFPRGRYGVLGYFNADTLPRQVISVGQ